jgi:hypothetical protein
VPNYYGQAAGTVPGIGVGGVALQPIQQPTALEPGDSVWLFGVVPAANAGGAADALIKGEQPAINTASIPICITPPSQGGGSPMVTFEFSFYATGTLVPAAPGAFEIDIQEADTDADAFYILPTNAAYKVAAVVAATNKARVDLSPTGGKFMRVLLLTRANGVDLVAKATRLA